MTYILKYFWTKFVQKLSVDSTEKNSVIPSLLFGSTVHIAQVLKNSKVAKSQNELEQQPFIIEIHMKKTRARGKSLLELWVTTLLPD